MLTLDRISKFHGANPILHEVTLAVPPGARIGVVGPNGVGKSTLLKIAAGLDEPDAGTVARSPSTLTVGYMPQEANGDAPLSGGQASRKALDRILVDAYDVLLLDEPTNNLDFSGLARLERFMRTSPASIVVVSHDREFLDRTVTRVLELDEWTRQAKEYAGGWSEYEAERDRARGRQYARWEGSVEERRRIEEQAARMRQWEERGYGQGRKKKKSKDVKKAYAKKLERVETVEKPYEPWELHIPLAVTSRSGQVVARLEGVVVERGAFRLGPLDFGLDWGERVALTGPNGSGKTTVLDALLGKVPLAEGTRYVGPGVVLGELDQARGRFSGSESLLDTFCRAADVRTDEARTLLAKYGLGADDVLRAAGSLSPGERTRAAVALLVVRGVNCLLLDEPTNHLDLPAIEELEAALERYDGTVLLVTHDRRFLERFAATRTVQLE
jgi:ATPase subunit of ABC transporter with duplicated ATPase domains